MDPKMDSGYLEPGETMDDDYDFTKPLLPEEILGIIDQLICHEVLPLDIYSIFYVNDILDGVAYGAPAGPDNLHQLIYR